MGTGSLGCDMFLGFVLVRVAVGQRRGRRGRPRSEGESKPEESCEWRTCHGLKLARGLGGWNPG